MNAEWLDQLEAERNSMQTWLRDADCQELAADVLDARGDRVKAAQNRAYAREIRAGVFDQVHRN